MKLFMIEKDTAKVMKFGDKSRTEDDQELQFRAQKKMLKVITNANCICSNQL